jgi:hypothetical protein
MNLSACGTLPTRVEGNTWYRGFDPKFTASPLDAAHTVDVASRFSLGKRSTRPYEILYFAETHEVALYEIGAMLGSRAVPNGNAANKHVSSTIINVRVNLHKIVDLTDSAIQRQLETTAQELTGDWRSYAPHSHATYAKGHVAVAPTQQLGEELFKVPDLEGFVTLSAKCPDHMILGVFTEKLHSGSEIRFIDTSGNTYSIP